VPQTFVAQTKEKLSYVQETLAIVVETYSPSSWMEHPKEIQENPETKRVEPEDSFGDVDEEVPLDEDSKKVEVTPPSKAKDEPPKMDVSDSEILSSPLKTTTGEEKPTAKSKEEVP